MDIIRKGEQRPRKDRSRIARFAADIRSGIRGLDGRLLASSRKAETSALILVACVWLPELNKLITSEDAGWTVYLTAVELTRAALCYLFVQNVFGKAAALWFVTQAIDEATGRNVWNYAQDWQEIALFTVLASATWVYWYHHQKQ